MAHNGGDEEFIIIISDSEDDSSDYGDVQDPEPPLQMNGQDQIQQEINDYFKELQPIVQQLPPLTPDQPSVQPSLSVGASSSSSSSSQSGGTITVADSAPMELDRPNGHSAPVLPAVIALPAVILPPNNDPDYVIAWKSNNAVLSLSGLNAHISICALNTVHSVFTAMSEILERCGIEVVHSHATSDEIKTLYFFHGQVTARAFEIFPEMNVERIYLAAIGLFVLRFPQHFRLL